MAMFRHEARRNLQRSGTSGAGWPVALNAPVNGQNASMAPSSCSSVMVCVEMVPNATGGR